MMKVTIEALTSIDEVYRVARETQGIPYTGSILSIKKWESWLFSEESPIRIFQLRIHIEDIPYWVHGHLIRHHIGIEWFVRTQRPDSINPVKYDRNKAPQDKLINLTMICNPQSLINISRRRLCNNASKETKDVWTLVREKIRKHSDPYISVIAKTMMPDCEYRGYICYSTKSCGKCIIRNDKT